MKFVEYKCKCGITEHAYLDTQKIKNKILCLHCGKYMKRIYSSFAFKVNGYNYKNGYNKTKKLDEKNKNK